METRLPEANTLSARVAGSVFHPFASRGSGIGARLLNTVEAFAAAHRYRRLLLNTAPFLLAAVQLYERHGFRYTGEEPDLFGTQLLTMAKDIRTG